MYLYYTGAKQYLVVQGKKEWSLGGFPSSSKIQNGEIGSLFSSVSLVDIEQAKRNVIGVVLKNELGVDVSNLRIWFESPTDAYCKYEIAAVSLAKNSKDQYYMEEISNNEALPYNATFYSADGESNSKPIGDLPSGGMIGLWIKRTIDKAKISSLFTIDALKARTTNLPTQEDVVLKISWDDDESSSSIV